MNFAHLTNQTSGGSYIYAYEMHLALVKQGHLSKILYSDAAMRPLSDKFLRRSTLSFARGAWHGTRRTHHPPSEDDLEGVDVVVLHSVADWFDVPAWLEDVADRFQFLAVMHDLWHVSGGCFVYQNCHLFGDRCTPCPILKWPTNGFLAAQELRRKTRAYHKAGVRFVANSQWLKSVVGKSLVVNGGNVAVIPPAVDPDVFHPRDRRSCRAKLGIDQDVLILASGCASLTDTNKDTAGLLQMLDELAMPNLVILVFGEGAISSPPGLDVRWLGMQAGRDCLATIYGAADLFASASRMETYGLTLAEAYACGCAVVAHQVGGIPEALPEDPSVTLVPLADRKAFIEALRFQLERCLKQTPSTGVGRASPQAPSPSATVQGLYDVCNSEEDRSE